MSRIGSSAIIIPDGVTCNYANSLFTVKGKLGELSYTVPAEVKVVFENNIITLSIANTNNKLLKALWGTTRANLNNTVLGVSEGFSKKIEINGVGYRAAVQGKFLNMQLGFSHDINYPIPEGITITVDKNPAAINVSGIDKQKVGQISSEIRAHRPPEPYKGKGLKYSDEYILRKEGKKK